MKKATLTQTKNQLSKPIDQVRHGETILVLDRGRPVARIEPALSAGTGSDPGGRVARLERQGVLRRAIERPSRRFWDRRLPAVRRGAGIVEALLADRRSGR